MKNFFTLITIFCAFIMPACSAKTVDPIEPTLLIEPTSLSFSTSASTKSVTITTNQPSWDAVFVGTVPQGWTLNKKTKELSVTVTKNTDLQQQTATIKITAGSLNKDILVSQLGEAPAILLDKSSISLPNNDASTITIVATTNVEIDTAFSDSWIVSTVQSSSKVMTDVSYTFEVQKNTGKSRSAIITFTAKGATLPTAKVTVSQPEAPDPTLLYSAQELVINSGSGGTINEQTVSKLKNMEEGTIIVQYLTTGSGIQSLFGIGDQAAQNNHFHLYISGSTIGFETRGAGDIRGSSSTSRPITELQTIALKAEKGVGYKIFANGKLIMDEAFVDGAYKFISNIPNINNAFVGKTPRIGNTYPYSGSVKSIKIYNRLVSDAELITITNETPAPFEYTPLAKFDMFTKGDATGCDWFRIPSLLALKSGVVLASIDARFGGTYDSPNNLDNTLRRSTDGGKTFGAPTFPLAFLDYPHAGGNKTWSASFIDPVMMQDHTSGRVYMMIDAFPWGGGIATGNRCFPGSGFKTIEGKKYLALTNLAVPTNKEEADHDMSNFNFTIRENGVIWNDTDNLATEYSVNGKFELLKNGVAQMVKQQENNSIDVPMSIYFERSIFRVFRTCYLWIIHSDDDGATWSDPINVSYLKNETEQYFIAGPGNSIQIQKGVHAGRLLFPVYFKIGNTERCGVIYSDNQGRTWQRGETPALGSGVGKMSEAQLIELPDGSVAIFARNGWKGMISYAISKDGGATFATSEPTTLQNAGNNGCQISVINLSKQIDGFPAVALSYSNNADSRTDGTIAIGLIKKYLDTYVFDWKYQQLISPGDYGYSCLTELPNGNLGLLFEGNNLQKIQFMEIDIETLK